MADIQSTTTDRSLDLLKYSVLFVVIAVVIAILLYRFKIGGELASKSDEWSNFGTYIGGVLGPLISFVTLLAVLKTVYMQRDLLETQKNEFTDLSAKQDQQLVLAKAEAGRVKVQAYQATVLNVLESFSAEFKDDARELAVSASNVASRGLNILDSARLVESYKSREDEARKKVSEFKILALELSINEYQNTDEIKRKFGPELLRILKIEV